MQILGKRSKILLIAVAIAMLAALGLSFALWDTQAVKATSGDLSQYANAKVGDIIEFGQYYQTLDKDSDGEYIKTPIKWIVVDKNERSGEITLMSKYILACGSFFGNYYDDGTGSGYKYNDGKDSELAGTAFNQSYTESTARAYLNNLERMDMGGDIFDPIAGYVPSGLDSTVESGLLSSVGFSNYKYYTNLDYATESGKALADSPDSGMIKRADHPNQIFYKRPITSTAYKNRPMAKGFFDEAFTDEEKTGIVPKTIPGFYGHRWPTRMHNVSNKSYMPGSVDKVWLPSVTELNIMGGNDWNGEKDDWTGPGDAVSSTAFEYFENYNKYPNPYNRNRNNTSVSDALVGQRTALARNGMAGNYSIPVYDKGTMNPKTAISTVVNTSDRYWTRSPMSTWFYDMRLIEAGSGAFISYATRYSSVGIRPCVTLKY